MSGVNEEKKAKPTSLLSCISSCISSIVCAVLSKSTASSISISQPTPQHYSPRISISPRIAKEDTNAEEEHDELLNVHLFRIAARGLVVGDPVFDELLQREIRLHEGI